jgi:hypothetical protein
MNLAEMRRTVESRLEPQSYNYGVLTQWLRGHEHAAMEVTVFPLATDPDQLDHAEQVLAALPNVYRTLRITDGKFGRARDLRWQVRALVAMNALALERKPLGRGGWAASQ